MRSVMKGCGLVILKPDAHRDLIVEKIIEDTKKAGFRIVLRKDIYITREQAELVYLENKNDDSYPYAVRSLLNGKSTLLIVEYSKKRVLQALKQLRGKANQGGLRKKYAPYFGEDIEEKLGKGLLRYEMAQNRLHVPDSIRSMVRIMKEFLTAKEKMILFIKMLYSLIRRTKQHSASSLLNKENKFKFT